MKAVGLVALGAVLCTGCLQKGADLQSLPRLGGAPAVPSTHATAPPQPSFGPSGGAGTAVLPTPAVGVSRGPITAPVFQLAFHQSLRQTEDSGGLTTFRLRVPLGRAGARVRVGIAAGEGTLAVQKVTVAHAGPSGALAEPAQALTFAGSQGFVAQAWERRESDPVALSVVAGDEVDVSVEANGALAAGILPSFVDSYAEVGAHAADLSLQNAVPHPIDVGVDTVEVEAAPDFAFIAIGDSITEGYVGGDEDFRKAWPGATQALTGRPVGNAGISGQGIYEELQNLDREVLSQHGVTDCIVLLGTNDLGGDLSATDIEGRLQDLFDRLTPFCRVWAGTLLPKEMTTSGNLAQVQADRMAVNAWIRSGATVNGVIDFEQAMAVPGDPNHFAPGLTIDGIHPSLEGQAVLAKTAAELVARMRGPDAPPPLTP